MSELAQVITALAVLITALTGLYGVHQSLSTKLEVIRKDVNSNLTNTQANLAEAVHALAGANQKLESALMVIEGLREQMHVLEEMRRD